MKFNKRNIFNFIKKEQIQQLFEQFENACHDYKGIECWSAKELQSIFNYAEKYTFLKVIDKAKDASKTEAGRFLIILLILPK